MNFKKLISVTLSTAMLCSMVLTGCTGGGGTAGNTTTAPPADTTVAQNTASENTTAAQNTTSGGTKDAGSLSPFPKEVVNESPAIDGGVLNVALVSSSSFAGTLNPVFYEDNYDAQIIDWFTEGIISYDENFVADQDGAATYTYDKDKKTITLTINDNIKWHDGEPVTMDDLVFAYEVICNKDYKGLRYDEKMMNVVGAVEYHDGASDKIAGLTLSDDKKTLTIEFKEFMPSTLVGGFWSSPIPRHYWEGIEVKDMAAHEKTRSTPIGYGAFKVKNVVPGESVEFERFDDYWRGKPKLDGVIVTLTKPDLIPAAMKEGKFDIAEFSAQQYPDYMNPTNYQYVGDLATVFSYTGFKLGKFDAETTTNIYNPDSKMNNLQLRQAIGYAINNAELGETLYNGLRVLATTVITPRHASYQNKSLEGYNYNPEKAKQLLDEAGYKDVNNDGFREDPNGQPFKITWAMMEGQGADTIAQYKIEQWKEVGLNVELFNGRLTEFNAFYDAVEMDDPAIDMYDAAWQTGYDPNPSNLWGHKSNANYTRYTSDKFDEIIANISSDKAWDSDYLAQQYQDWQKQFFEEAPAIPTLWRVVFYAVNNRVKNYNTTASDVIQGNHLIELTADKPAL